jgi:hypothetical protein
MFSIKAKETVPKKLLLAKISIKTHSFGGNIKTEIFR